MEINEITKGLAEILEKLQEVNDDYRQVQKNPLTFDWELFEKYGVSDDSPTKDEWQYSFNQDAESAKTEYPDFSYGEEPYADWVEFCESRQSQAAWGLEKKIYAKREELEKEIEFYQREITEFVLRMSGGWSE